MVEKKHPFGIPRNVAAMGLVSLFNDIASEMIYPVLPIFLTATLGAPIAAVGLIEGFAECVASIFKVVSGFLSDRLNVRKPFIVLGYASSTVAKLLFGLATSWHLVFFAKAFDRFGKGARTAPRDALISASTPAHIRGRAFGFHRGMDTVGAIIGPLLALSLLPFFRHNLRILFLIAFIPSVIGVLLVITLVREIRPSREEHVKYASWKTLGAPYFMFLFVSAIFAIGNSSDAFILLRAKEMGITLAHLILMYVLFNITYSIGSTPAGIMSDKIGPKKVLVAGFLLFAVVYAFFGLISNSIWLWLLFPIYGFYMALTDGVGKAYIAHLIPQERLGMAFGIYQVVVGLGAFMASLFAGILWTYLHSSAPFILGSIMALLAAILFLIIPVHAPRLSPRIQ